jgi:predicted nucleotidyltransferase component of viral defense system
MTSHPQRLAAMDDLHRAVAEIALRAARQHGFALAGGNALISHGVTARATMDVDLFTDRQHGVRAAAAAVEAALTAKRFKVARADLVAGLDQVFGDECGEGLAEWEVTAPGGRRMVLQMSYFKRQHKPVTHAGIGPVLDLEDVAAGKVAALAARAEPRDYYDTALLMGAGYTTARLIELARKADPGLTDRDFTMVARRLDRASNSMFTSLRVSPAVLAWIRARFAVWPRG